MTAILIAIVLMAGTGVLSLLTARKPVLSLFLGAAGPVIGACLGMIPVVAVVSSGVPLSLELGWQMPSGSFSLFLDPLAAVFVAAILFVSAAAAVYGTGYLRQVGEGARPAPSWFWFDILVASMVLVCLSRNGLLFLISWETMALSSFFLVAFENDKAEARKASWTYFLATYLGTAFLLPLFVILGRSAQTLDFNAFGAFLTPASSGACFALALVGFGTKAGIVPFHVWLPEAHPAAPSHVSAVMSGVMIKTGIYGLLRILLFLGPPPAWWGWTLLCVGIVSGIGGVLFALAQHDLKRLLAYHSVENIGIIFIGLGVGFLGRSYGLAVVSCLGFAGALIHVVNHALFKSLLFMAAGSAYRAAGHRDLDRLGALLKIMPFTGAAFLIGAAAICGLPPLNGFVGEFLIMLASLKGLLASGPEVAVPLAFALASLGLIGGLAVACFTKAFGIAFLGEARARYPEGIRESGASMVVPMIAVSIACVLIGAFGVFAARAILPAVAVAAGTAEMPDLASPLDALRAAALASFVAVGAAAGFFLLRKALLSRRESRRGVTWDCGYATPSSRMQYTASSYAQPITELFRFLLRTRKRIEPPSNYFPESASLETHTEDLGREALYRPAFASLSKLLSRLSVLQQGRTQAYVLYLVIALIALAVWKLR